MAFELVDVSLTAVLFAAVVSFIIGWLWHSPLLFGNLWLKLSGMTKAKINAVKKKSMAGSFIGSFLFTLVSMYVLAQFVSYASTGTFWEGIVLGFWVWLGFLVPLTLNTVFWEGKSFKLWLISAGHNLVCTAIGAGILSVWG